MNLIFLHFYYLSILQCHSNCIGESPGSSLIHIPPPRNISNPLRSHLPSKYIQNVSTHFSHVDSYHPAFGISPATLRGLHNCLLNTE
jgi:hypothetical protein